MSGPFDPAALARGLAAAANPLEALRLWAGAAAPPADLLAVIDPAALRPAPALRREGAEWLPVTLPGVRLSRIPPAPVVLSLAVGRREAFDDLLFTLGVPQALLLPFPVRAGGALLLARSGASFTTAEVDEQARRAAPLGDALAQFARRRPREALAPGAVREVAELFDLARDLARAESAAAAARVGAERLRELLQPTAGSLLLRIAESDAPAVVAWPDGVAGEEAADRAASSMGMPPSDATRRRGATAERQLSWLTSPSASTLVGLALGWAGPAPEAAERIAGAVQASLTLAADRLAVQRRDEENRLRAVVEGLPLGVALVAADGRVRLVNAVGRRLLDEIGAWPGDGGRLERIASADLGPLLEQARRGRPAEAEIHLPAGGRALKVQVVPAAPAPASPRDPAGEVLVVVEDVTGTRRQQAQLARAEKLSAMGVLISGIVHEINNPLGTIQGYAEMLGREAAPEKRERWLATLSDEARRCQKIVGDLLTFARPQAPGRRPISLAAVAERALALVGHSFRKAGVEAVLQASPETPALEADPDAVLQVLINLLTNALHALETFAGPRRVRIEIGPEGGDRVVLVVEDTGPGIAPEHLDRVFDPFFTTKPEGKGTGLGLSLVAATVRDHGGAIDVESAPGKGASFRITLPVKAPAAPGAHGAGASAQPELSGARVLVVEKEASAAGALAQLLDHAGARTEVQQDGASALEKLLADPPDAVIWDLSLAEVSGAALVEELERRAPRLLDRLIFAGGDAQAGASGAALGKGARPVLGKPFDPPLVLRTVGAVTGRGRRPGAT